MTSTSRVAAPAPLRTVPDPLAVRVEAAATRLAGALGLLDLTVTDATGHPWLMSCAVGLDGALGPVVASDQPLIDAGLSDPVPVSVLEAATAAVADCWAEPGFRRALLRWAAREDLADELDGQRQREDDVTRAWEAYQDELRWLAEQQAAVAHAQLRVAATDESLTDEQQTVALRLIAGGFPGTPEDLLATVTAILT